MNKRYLTMVYGTDQITVEKNSPIWGIEPDYFRDKFWNIDGVWHGSVGKDLLKDSDSFEDNSLLCKYSFDNTLLDLVTNTEAITVGNITYSNQGPFDTSSVNIKNSQGSTYIETRDIDLSNTDSLTVAMPLKVDNDPEYILEGSKNHIFTFSPREGDANENTVQPELTINDDKTIEVHNHLKDGSFWSKKFQLENILNKRYIKLMISMSKYELTVSVDGEIIGTAISPKPFLRDSGKFIIGSKTNSSSFSMKNFEVYNKTLSKLEQREIINQQRFIDQKFDGAEISETESNPPSFAYIEKNGKLLSFVVDNEGNIISEQLERKRGMLSENDNTLRLTSDNIIVDKYGQEVSGIGGLDNDCLEICGTPEDFCATLI